MTPIPFYEILPFFLILGIIATGPMLYHKWWDKNSNKLLISLLLGMPVMYFLIAQGNINQLEHVILFDYLPFIILLSTLYVITGGINIGGDIEATPATNSIFLGTGAILASVIGTTGASMLLVRPLIQTNSERQFKSHTLLFFIAIVANCGGLLTPIGDPPLFIMYLKGAPFTWFFQLFPEWLFINSLLIVIYYMFDFYFYRKESPVNIKKDKSIFVPIKIKGSKNFIVLAAVILTIAIVNANTFPVFKRYEYLKFSREILLLLLMFFSLKYTPKKYFQDNGFSWEPVKEIAYIFLGIFITMTPCILYLESNATNLGIKSPAQFYFLTGLLSSFLDNTPTAVTFHSLALGMNEQSGIFLAYTDKIAGIPSSLLKAISLAAVLFGSMTYIGNGPNFMIKSIAEASQIRMPGFFSYIFRFSLVILLPVFILVWLIFI
ncbi:MAG: sodium:proton antiporter [Lentimicrobiaceae bacterium]|nr:sodium:proton antiporter [Lentimicrobiaceae bacterium]